MMLFFNLDFRYIDVACIRNLKMIEIVSDTIRISQKFEIFKTWHNSSYIQFSPKNRDRWYHQFF